MTSVGELPAPARPRSRYSTRPLPLYRYVPGLHPHPTRDPRGHSYDANPRLQRHPCWNPEEWLELEDWLYGVDLFNAFYFWEAHEAWEGLWAAVDRAGRVGQTLQGLIQVAAALLKTHMTVAAGARLLSTEGLDKLRRAVGPSPRFMGLDLSQVIVEFERFFAPLMRGELPKVADVPPLHLQSDEVPSTTSTG